MDSVRHRAADKDEAEQGPAQPTTILQEDATFDEIVVWGHEMMPEETSDPYVKGMTEWISFAAQMHSYPPLDRSGE
ncbi:MAG: hypothetical protein M1838_002561 [Thelocarpon superellum]|nr:MAG: hypothetical protein M1838_002561 [Thelocarpon superellum]